MRVLIGVEDVKTVDNWRAKFSGAAEHKGARGRVWLHAPSWLRLYFAATAPPPEAIGGEAAEPAASDRKVYFDGLIAEVKYRELVKEFVSAADVEKWQLEFSSGLSAIASMAERAAPDVADMLNTFLDSEREKIETRLHGNTNGHTKVSGTNNGNTSDG